MLGLILSLLGVGGGLGALTWLLGPAAMLGLGRSALDAGKTFLGRLPKLSLSQIICIVLAVALLVQHVVDHRHAAKLEGQLTNCSKALTDTRAAFSATVGNYRAAATKAAAEDKANADRVRAEQSQINQETSDEFQARLADARARAQRLRDQLAQAAAHPGSSSTAPVPRLPAPVGGPAQGAGDHEFSIADRLTATEQAIQLDELIKWVKEQAGVEVNGAAGANSDKP